MYVIQSGIGTAIPVCSRGKTFPVLLGCTIVARDHFGIYLRDMIASMHVERRHILENSLTHPRRNNAAS